MSLSSFTVRDYQHKDPPKKLEFCRISPFLPQRLTPREAKLQSESFLMCLEQNKGNLIILCAWVQLRQPGISKRYGLSNGTRDILRVGLLFPPPLN